MNEYQQSLKIQRDNNSALSYAKKEGHEEGLVEGRHAEALAIATKLKAKNMPIDEIAEITGLSMAEIEKL